MGGEILFIESSVSEGKGVLSTTGNLGDVMKESAQIAYQYIKAHPEVTGLTAEEPFDMAKVVVRRTAVHTDLGIEIVVMVMGRTS